VKVYKLKNILTSPPLGTTHIAYTPLRYNYIRHEDDGYCVWLGVKHGGWSFMLHFQHPHYHQLVCVPKQNEAQNND
jgi:hypothetical protein